MNVNFISRKDLEMYNQGMWPVFCISIIKLSTPFFHFYLFWLLRPFFKLLRLLSCNLSHLCSSGYFPAHTDPHPLLHLFSFSLLTYSLASPFYFFFPFHIINEPILTYSGNYTTSSFHFTQAVTKFLHLSTLNICIKVGCLFLSEEYDIYIYPHVYQ
jgi:hypothetical protein